MIPLWISISSGRLNRNLNKMLEYLEMPGRVSLSATGFYRTPKIHYDRATFTGRPFYYYAYQLPLDFLPGHVDAVLAAIRSALSAS